MRLEHSSLPVALLFAGLFLFAPAEEARADMVITNKGAVFVGKIWERDVTDTKIVLRWPYRLEQAQMKWEFRRGNNADEVRYFWRNPDPNTYKDIPPEEYWEKYKPPPDGKFPIAKKYLVHYKRWKESKTNNEDYTDLFVRPTDLLRGKGLSARPYRNKDPLFTIKFPNQWRATLKKEIVIARSSKPGSHGFRPLIHVFAVKRVKKIDVEEQVRLILLQIKSVAEVFKLEERGRLKTQGLSSFEIEITTRSTVKGRPVLAKRKILFREKYTYFFVAFAHERDFDGMKQLFEASMKSLWIGEDEKRKNRKKGTK